MRLRSIHFQQDTLFGLQTIAQVRLTVEFANPVDDIADAFFNSLEPADEDQRVGLRQRFAKLDAMLPESDLHIYLVRHGGNLVGIRSGWSSRDQII